MTRSAFEVVGRGPGTDGRIVRAVDGLRRFTSADSAQFRGLASKHRVLVVRGVPEHPRFQLLLTRALGDVYADLDGRRPELRLESGERNPYGHLWHCDTSWAAHPARFTLLYALRVGGESVRTDLADMVSAYEALPAEVKTELRALRVFHHVERARAVRFTKPMASVADERRGLRDRLQRWSLARRFPARSLEKPPEPGVLHPLVGHGPERFVLLGEHAYQLEGWSLERSIEFLRELTSRCTGSFATHTWQAGDLLVFENATHLHRRGDQGAAERLLRRTLALGDRAPERRAAQI